MGQEKIGSESKRTKFLPRISKNNQLLVKLPQKNKTKLLRGQFKIDDKNRLIYLINEPSGWHRKYKISNKIIFEGKWELTSDHDLVLNLKKEEGYRKRSLRLRGVILDLGKEFLLFQIKSKTSGEITRISHLKLKGVFSSDRFNRIIFEVGKKEKPDILIFRNTWQLNRSKQIIYNYEKLETKTKHTLTFKGYWQIKDKNRLTYLLEGSNESGFDFHVNLETPNLYPATGKIKYRIGIGLKKRREEKLIVLVGRWKFSRKWGLAFEIDYGDGRLKRIYFSSVLTLTQKDKLIFSLYNRDRKPLEMSITFKRNQLAKKDYEYFLRLKKERKISTLELGGKIRF